MNHNQRDNRTDASALLQSAVAAHQSGDSTQARALYTRILEIYPEHFDATHLLGVLALQAGEFDQAAHAIVQALVLRPSDAAALSNLGTVYLRSNRLELALTQFQRALEVSPRSVSALINFGTVHRALGRPREALQPLSAASKIDPESTTVWNLLGACLLDTGDTLGAVAAFERATQVDPNAPSGWANLAVALNNIGEFERARPHAERAVALQPDSASALAARAAVEFEEGDVDAALATYRQALDLPDPSAQICCAYANALWTVGRCDEADELLRQAVAIDGNNVIARWKQGLSHFRPYFDSVAQVERSREAMNDSLAGLEAWVESADAHDAYAAVGTTQPFYIVYQPYNNRELMSRYGRLCSEIMKKSPIRVSDPASAQTHEVSHGRTRQQRIRVGIVSAHIRDHSVWNAITKGWVVELDKSRIELSLFYLGRKSDLETVLAKEHAAHFVDGAKTLQGWVDAIQGAGLDVLIYPEIGMDALTMQLASMRLAPVQATSWGQPDTSGLPTMDLYFSAERLEPPDAQACYSEKLVLLPNLGVSLEPLTPQAVNPSLAALGLPSNEPLLLCPGTPFKYTPASDSIWPRIAKGLSRSVGSRGLLSAALGRLRGKGFGRLVFFRGGDISTNRPLEARLRRAFDTADVDFDAQVRIIPHLDRARFFGLMQSASLLLDTVGFSGFNNALQATEAGLPVLAREAEFMRGRLASGIMRHMGIDELVATSDDEFVSKAVGYANDPQKLQSFRTLIAERRAALFHDHEPVRVLERCLEAAVRARAGR